MPALDLDEATGEEEKLSNEDLIVLARCAERAECWDDMQAYMKARVESTGGLSMDERECLSKAYKEALAPRRQAARVARSCFQQEEEAGRATNAALAEGYYNKVMAEVCTICDEVIKLLEFDLLPKAENAEPRVFYLKMQGDFYRYLAEFMEDDGLSKATEGAQAAYHAGVEEAQTHLMCTHPVRLGLALNYSVFQHQVLQDTRSAMETAKAAWQEASRSLEGMPEEAVRDAQLCLDSLLENWRSWETECEFAA
eukprot:TRINITY_DN12161_c0_g1_i1.p1 TRINITY_DN12161_c0_g1~~TRINITY_DN12161_c0_g1_i1.p1  ORF type:complete len:278 (-),score=81.51 TRINITY_DN12161_c0_g1_i1:102-863(-)